MVEGKRLNCVYFPEVDRFLVALEGKSVGKDALLRSRWYWDLEYYRYLPASRISFAAIDEFLEKFPHELCCEVTNLCNFSCPVCVADAKAVKSTQMRMEVYDEALEDKPWTVKRITLTGGEPTLHPCLPEMLEQAVGVSVGVVLSTNGFLPKKLEKALKDNRSTIVNISLHGWKREHDDFVGREGAYEKALESIQVGATYAMAVQVHTTVVPQTIKRLDKLCAVLSELLISEHRLNLVKPRGRRLVSSVRYEDLLRIVADLQVPYKVSIKKKGQPFLFINCEGRKEIRDVQEC